MPVALPPVRQRKGYDCGLAVVESILAAFDVAHGRKSMKALLGTTPLDGTDPRAIESFLRRVGLCVQSGSMTLADLVHHTRLGRAVVCCVTHEGVGHYVAVSRVRGGYVYRMCPSGDGVCERSSLFLSRWSDVAWSGCRLSCWGIACWRGW